MLRTRSTDPTPGERLSPIRPPTTGQSVVRWEWRVFAHHAPMRELTGQIAIGPPRETVDSYILSSGSVHSAKIRDGVLEFKQLNRLAHGGLEQWHPVFKARFPLGRSELRRACEWLGVAPPETPAAGISQTAFLRDVIAPNPGFRTVAVVKRRSPIALGDCPGEEVKLEVDGAPVESLAFEHEDPEILLETLRKLNFRVDKNTSFPRGLKQLTGWPEKPQ